jgi:hypothetical protein
LSQVELEVEYEKEFKYPVRYNWNLGNGYSRSNVSDSKIKHYFGNVGEMPINVEVFTPYQRKTLSLQSKILVEKNMDLIVDRKNIAIGESASLKINFKSPVSNLLNTWSFSKGFSTETKDPTVESTVTKTFTAGGNYTVQCLVSMTVDQVKYNTTVKSYVNVVQKISGFDIECSRTPIATEK